MRAVVFKRSLPITEPEALVDIELPRPDPGGRDLLVKVQAVSVNPVDTKVRRGGDPADGMRVLGWDAAGMVEAVGPEATLFKPGDAVFYAGPLMRPGANAELHLVDERIVGARLLTEIAALIDRGTIRTTLKEIVGPIDAAHLKKAHALIESGKAVGKLVLAGWPAH